MAQKRYLVISMEIDDTAPGIVFKNLLKAMARSASVTVICPRIDASFLEGDVEILPIDFHQHSWRTLERRWRFIGCNPSDGAFVRKVMRLYSDLLGSRSYDALLTFTSNGFYAAIDLSRAIARDVLATKWIVYSVDAIPCPLPWFEGHESSHRHLTGHIRSVCEDADMVISSNELMMEYQRSVLGQRFSGRMDYLYTPISTLCEDPSRRAAHDGLNILYAGSIYGLRRIDGLLEGFRRFLSDRPDAHLVFVGDVRKSYREQCRDLEASGCVEFHPYTKDIESWYSVADILLDIAADILDDVFLSSKIISYLPVPCPIVAVSGDNSPSRRIFPDCDSIIHCHNNADEVYSALVSASNPGVVVQRKNFVEKFNARTLADRFLSILEK